MNLYVSVVFAGFLALSAATPAAAEPNVVATIKPLHSLIAAVMKNVGTPSLIIEGASSPHTHALKPSQAANLSRADLVFWFGRNLEAFMEKPVQTIATKATVIELLESSELTKLPFRNLESFSSEDHAHDEHAHDEKKHDEYGHHGHRHGEFDPHVWLDPENAKAIVTVIRDTLARIDAKHAATYKSNASATIKRLDDLTAKIRKSLSHAGDYKFITFHDAYQYFEKRFHLPSSGTLTVSPEVMPGAERLRIIRTKVTKERVNCMLAEPQFNTKLVTTVIEGTLARSGVIDPLGTTLDAGPELYFQLIRAMAKSFADCLHAG
jgi:zinc transport system substrate-binding protein